MSDCRRRRLTYALVMLLWSRYLQKTARELGRRGTDSQLKQAKIRIDRSSLRNSLRSALGRCDAAVSTIRPSVLTIPVKYIDKDAPDAVGFGSADDPGHGEVDGVFCVSP